MKRSELYRIREMIEKAAVSLTDGDAINAVELFPAWAVRTEYTINQRVRYDGKLYKVVQSHTSQDGWEPSNVPALFTEVAKHGEIPVWKQPTGAHDAYMTGDKVHYPTKNDPVYESTMDYNVYSPESYPQGWNQIV